MELRHLEYFVAVAEQLNFSRAAEMLYVTQPLLSQQIAELEKELGVVLLSRNRRSVRLTNAGLALLSEARIILARVNGAKKIVQDAESGIGLGGKLRIGYDQVFDRSLITKTVYQFREMYPCVDCSLTCCNFAKLIYSVSENELDVGFTLRPNEKLSPNFDRLTVGVDILSMFVADPLVTNGAPSSTDGEFSFVNDMVNRYPIYAIERDSKGINSMITVLSHLHAMPQFMFVETVADIMMNVESGSGIAFLPHRLAHLYPTSGISVLPLKGVPDADIDLTAIWNKKDQNPLIKTFLEQISAAEAD